MRTHVCTCVGAKRLAQKLQKIFDVLHLRCEYYAYVLTFDSYTFVWEALGHGDVSKA
jgi:hypothetical protein